MKSKAKAKITALFEFSSMGTLKGIFLNAEDEQDQAVLEKGLSRLFRPNYFHLLKRLFRNDQ